MTTIIITIICIIMIVRMIKMKKMKMKIFEQPVKNAAWTCVLDHAQVKCYIFAKCRLEHGLNTSVVL